MRIIEVTSCADCPYHRDLEWEEDDGVAAWFCPLVMETVQQEMGAQMFHNRCPLKEMS